MGMLFVWQCFQVAILFRKLIKFNGLSLAFFPRDRILRQNYLNVFKCLAPTNDTGRTFLDKIKLYAGRGVVKIVAIVV